MLSDATRHFGNFTQHDDDSLHGSYLSGQFHLTLVQDLSFGHVADMGKPPKNEGTSLRYIPSHMLHSIIACYPYLKPCSFAIRDVLNRQKQHAVPSVMLQGNAKDCCQSDQILINYIM